MTRFEEICAKADALREAAKRCQDQGKYFMAAVWMHKADLVESKIRDMTVDHAREVVG